MEDIEQRYESGQLGGEGQGIIGDALRSINHWMPQNGNTTQLYFVVRDAPTATSSGNFFRDGQKKDHTLHFTLGEQVLAQVWDPEPGSAFYTLHLDLWAFNMQLPHARGIPVLEWNNGNRAKTFATYSCPYHPWPEVRIGEKGCCVAQLLGRTQFAVIPRHPQHLQSHTKWINWGFKDGIFCTTVYHINEQ